MKTAIIYSGQARTFRQLWENHHWMVWRKFPDPHFFISVEDNAQAQDMVLIRKKFPADRVFFETHQQPTIVEPTVNPVISGWAPSATPQAILRQLWSLNRAYMFFAESKGFIWERPVSAFDIVVRIRPDTHFIRVDKPAIVAPSSAFTPWWSCWGGVNDRFAVLGSTAAHAYFNTYRELDSMLADGAPLHPESLIHESLRRNYIQMLPLSSEFRMLRPNGSMTPFDPTETDLAEYARSRP